MRALRLAKTWLDDHEVSHTGHVTRPLAYVIVLATYGIGFGLGVWMAFSYLLSSRTRADLQDATGFTFGDAISAYLAVFAVVIALPLLRLEAPSWWRPLAAGEASWRSEARAFGLATVCIAVGLSVSTMLLDMPAYPRASGTGAAMGDLVGALLAGPAEEIVVLVVPLIFLRAARWPWWSVIAAAVVLRLLYHLYYGPSAAGLALWALGMVVVYLRTHAVLGLVLAHSWYDVSSTIASYWSEPVGIIMAAAPLAATASYYWIKGVRAVSTRRTLAGAGGN